MQGSQYFFSQERPCHTLPYKQQLWMYLATITSGYLWNIVDMFSCKLKRFATIYDESIGNEYKKEYAHLQVPKANKVLHIGCGSYPLTTIILAQYDNINHVVGIDSDQKAVHQAQTIIAQKKLQNHITIEYGTGQEYPTHKFNIIIISSCSWPKLDIIHHVITTAQKNTLIIIRELNHVVSPIMSCISTHPDIVIDKHITYCPFPFRGPFGWQTFYLKKT